jgi:hypothetical protein
MIFPRAFYMSPDEQRGFSAPADWLKRMNLERKNYERLLRYPHRYFRSAYFHGISPLAIEACPTSCSQGRNFVA